MKVYILFLVGAVIVHFSAYYSLVSFRPKILIPWILSGLFFVLWRASKEFSKKIKNKSKIKRLW